ncbi:hypothetical protein [Planotetraspora silvatica]|uniref:hypothetical protein n=1 Tax=Planotetraspora silvatica TaxID=234614 RepID=UPI0019520D4C|nr:hypothetical protein [Planotetraspora silvatica]
MPDFGVTRDLGCRIESAVLGDLVDPDHAPRLVGILEHVGHRLVGVPYRQVHVGRHVRIDREQAGPLHDRVDK